MVILIDHNIDEVFEVADRMAVLAQGRFMDAPRRRNSPKINSSR